MKKRIRLGLLCGPVLLLIGPFGAIVSGQWLLQMNGLPGSWGGMAIDACDTNTAVVAIGDLYRTVDGGASWNHMASPTGTVDVSVIDSSHMWIATQYGEIFATIDGGQTWGRQYYDSVKSNFMDYIKMFDVNRGVAMGDNPTLAAGPALFVVTADGGAHWISVNDSAFGGWSGDIWRRICFVNPMIGYFYESGVNPQKLYKTTTGGASWSASGYAGSYCEVVRFHDDRTALVIPSLIPTGKVFRTFDGGVTWQSFSAPLVTWGGDIEFAPDDASKVWSCDTGRVFFSADTGRTWKQQLAVQGRGWCRDLVFVDSRHGWLLGDNYVYHTSNGGDPGPDAVPSTSTRPLAFALNQNYPNPFNPTTAIRFQVPKTSFVSLAIYDVLGREVETLVNEQKVAGGYTVQFDGSRLASGVYFCRLSAGQFVETRKMVLIK